jgi:hypothetical protein
VFSPEFEAEMRVLRRLLAHNEFIGTTESAQGVLALLRCVNAHAEAIMKLFFSFVIPFIGLLLLATL